MLVDVDCQVDTAARQIGPHVDITTRNLLGPKRRKVRGVGDRWWVGLEDQDCHETRHLTVENVLTLRLPVYVACAVQSQIPGWVPLRVCRTMSDSASDYQQRR